MSYKQYNFNLLFSEKPKKTRADQSIPEIFTLCEKKRLALVCILLVQHAPINVFLFHVRTGRHLYHLPKVLFNHHVLAYFEISDLKEIRVLFFISRITK